MSSNASSKTPRSKAAGPAATVQGDGRHVRQGQHPGTPRSVAPKAGVPVRDVPSGKASSKVVWSAGSSHRPSLESGRKPNSPNPASGKASSAASSYSGPPGPSRDAALRARPKAVAREGTPVGHDVPGRQQSPPGTASSQQSSSQPSQRARRHSLTMSSNSGLVVSMGASSPRNTLNSTLGAAASDAPELALDREGLGTAGSSPRRTSGRSESSQNPSTPAKPPPAKKRGNPSKKRRVTGNSTTQTRPFSFSTDIRRGRRVRPNSVEEEQASTDEVSRPKVGSKARYGGAPKYTSIVPVPIPKRHATPLTPPDSGGHVSQGGASSSSDHWEPPSPGLDQGGVDVSASSSVSSSRLLSSRLERPPNLLLNCREGRDAQLRPPGGPDDDTPSPGGASTPHSGQSSGPSNVAGGSSSSSAHGRGRLYQKSSGKASERDMASMDHSKDHHASTEDFWPFSPIPSSPGMSPHAPSAQKMMDKRSSRQGQPPARNRVADFRSRHSFGSGGMLSASSSATSTGGASVEEASACVAMAAGAAVAVGRDAASEDEEGSRGSCSRERSDSASGSMERARNILRGQGRYGMHSARDAPRVQGSEAEERERHVSFCADRSNEVVQFCVDEKGQLPATTRVARRVFGGDLQAHMGNATGSSMRPHAGTGNTMSMAYDASSRPQPSSASAPNHSQAHMQTHMAGLAGLAHAAAGRISYERLPNVSHALEYSPRYKEGDSARSSAYMRPGIRDLAGPPADTSPANG